MMEWNPKTPSNWDWDNTPAVKISKSAQQSDWRVGDGSINSFSGSGFGNCSSKSSVSASVDSPAELAGARNPVEQGFSKNNPIKNTTEPLIGLKLGKRTYFKDDSARNSSSSSPSVKKCRASSTQTFHCQVQGCNADLAKAKEYHRKHRVCESHSKSPEVFVAGQARRFCQQCSRFHDLSEFDQKKRSCRRRLFDHNARRRKPQPELISFNSSRLSSSFYDYGYQMSFLLNQAPYGQTRPTASSSPCDYKHSQTKEPWDKSMSLGGAAGQLHFPDTELSNTFSTLSRDLDRLLPFKTTTAEVFDQGTETSVAASNLDGTTELRRALSLLSTDSWGSAHPRSTTPIQLVNTNPTTVARPAMHTLNSTTEYWQDEHPPTQQARALPFDYHGNGSQFQGFQLLKAPYETTFFDSSQIR